MGVVVVEEGALLRAFVPEPTVVCLTGDFDVDDAHTFEAAVQEAAPAPSPLVLDLSGLGFFGSAALQALLTVRQRREVTLRGVDRRVRRVLEVTHVDQLFSYG